VFDYETGERYLWWKDLYLKGLNLSYICFLS
jgi:hypothetical protein